MGIVSPQFVNWPKFFASFGAYFTTDLGNEAFQLPIPFWYTITFKNIQLLSVNSLFLTKYSFFFFFKNKGCHSTGKMQSDTQLLFLLNCLVLISYVCFMAMTVTSLGIASFLDEISLTEDSKGILRSIDENSKLKKNLPNLYAQFIEFVDVHSAMKQLSSIHSILLI